MLLFQNITMVKRKRTIFSSHIVSVDFFKIPFRFLVYRKSNIVNIQQQLYPDVVLDYLSTTLYLFYFYVCLCIYKWFYLISSQCTLNSNKCNGNTCICRCCTFTYILLLTVHSKQAMEYPGNISDWFSCVEINLSTYQIDVRSSLTWAESGWSPQSDRLAPTAPQNVPFLPVLMNPGKKNEWRDISGPGFDNMQGHCAPAEGYYI